MINDTGRRRSVSQRRERIDKWGRLGGIRADESCWALRDDWQLIMKIQEGSLTCSTKLLSPLFSTNIEAFNCLTDTGSSGFVKQFMYCTVCVCFFLNYLLFIKPAAHFFSIYHGDSVAAEKKFWLKLFSKKNNTFFLIYSFVDGSHTFLFWTAQRIY